jgi:hypothetical protein
MVSEEGIGYIVVLFGAESRDVRCNASASEG